MYAWEKISLTFLHLVSLVEKQPGNPVLQDISGVKELRFVTVRQSIHPLIIYKAACNLFIIPKARLRLKARAHNP